jgi:hypothetical protein
MAKDKALLNALGIPEEFAPPALNGRVDPLRTPANDPLAQIAASCAETARWTKLTFWLLLLLLVIIPIAWGMLIVAVQTLKH